jgi:hypothetical protein
MTHRRALIARLAIAAAILLAVALFLGTRSHRHYSGPSLSAATLRGEPDAHRTYPTKARVTLSGRASSALPAVRPSTA